MRIIKNLPLALGLTLFLAVVAPFVLVILFIGLCLEGDDFSICQGSPVYVERKPWS